MSLSARIIRLERKSAATALAALSDRQLVLRLAATLAELVSVAPDDSDVRGWMAAEGRRLGLDPSFADFDGQVISALQDEARAL
jgi:hypothetical protein